MRTVSDAAREVLRLFHYGPHFTSEQNRALASLDAAVETKCPQAIRRTGRRQAGRSKAPAGLPEGLACASPRWCRVA